MRLLDVERYELQSFQEYELPPYAILSHTWGSEEALYEHFRSNRESSLQRSGWRKVEFAAWQAKRDGLKWLWVDTCCIDKASSAELQEAINSMYRWYEEADRCYVYLADVDHAIYGGEDPMGSQFARSRWFRRGWTLQELLAPVSIAFYTKNWDHIGSKKNLSETISAITGIELAIVGNQVPIGTVSVAKRISWAARRRTSRLEDQAYCLLGLLGVNIPMLYGEGTRAFTRLQEEIIRVSNDHSIFAWGLKQTGGTHGTPGRLLADSPADFDGCGSIVPWGRAGQYEMTNLGLRVRLPIVRMKSFIDPDCTTREHLAILNCRFEEDFGGTIALRLQRQRRDGQYALSDSLYSSAFLEANQPARSLHPDTAGRHSIDISRERSPSQDEARLTGRLAFVSLKGLDSKARSLIAISRLPEPTRTCPSFQFQLTHTGYSKPETIRVSQCHPRRLWKPLASVMLGSQNPLDGTPATGVVGLESTFSGCYFAVAFGSSWIEKPGAVVRQLGKRPLLVPAVTLLVNGLTSLPEVSLQQLAFSPCTHRAGYCKDLTAEGTCSASSSAPDVVRITQRGSERLSTTIKEATIMEEKLFVVRVHAECLPPELDGEPDGEPNGEHDGARAKHVKATINDTHLRNFIDASYCISAWKVTSQLRRVSAHYAYYDED